MSGTGCYRLEFIFMAKQLLRAHEPPQALLVDRIAAILKFCCDPPVLVISGSSLNQVGRLNCNFPSLRYIISMRFFVVLKPLALLFAD